MEQYNIQTKKVYVRTGAAARMAKNRAIEKAEEYFEKVGNIKQRNLVLHGLVTQREKFQQALKAIQATARKEDEEIVSNIAEMMPTLQANCRTNDGKTCRNTLYMLMAPSDETKVNPKKSAKKSAKIARKLGVTTRYYKTHLKAGMLARRAALDAVGENWRPRLTQSHKRKSISIFTPQFIARLHR